MQIKQYSRKDIKHHIKLYIDIDRYFIDALKSDRKGQELKYPAVLSIVNATFSRADVFAGAFECCDSASRAQSDVAY